MKTLLIITSVFLMACSAQKDPGPSLKEWNYTDEWHYTDNGQRLQVYKTRTGKRFVFILNRQQTGFKRHYL